MPIDLQTLKNQAEGHVSGFLKSRGVSGIAQDETNIQAKILAQRNKLRSTLGLGNNVQFDKGTEMLDMKNREASGARSLNNQRQNMTDTLAFLVNRLQNAGLDRQSAESTARQLVLTMQGQDFTASENKKNRNSAVITQNSKDAYALRAAEDERLATSRARRLSLENTVMSSLFGLGGMAIGALLAVPTGGASVVAGAALGGIAGTSAGAVTKSSMGRTAGVESPVMMSKSGG